MAFVRNVVKQRAERRRLLTYNTLKGEGVLSDIRIIDEFDASTSVLYHDRQYLLGKYPDDIAYDKRKKRLIWIGKGSPSPTPEREKMFCEVYDKLKDENDQFDFDVLILLLGGKPLFTENTAIQFMQQKIQYQEIIHVKKEIYKKK